MEERIIKSGFDEELIIDISKGNLESLNKLYKMTSSMVYGLALSITKNIEDAKDVLQDTYIKVYEKAYLYKPLNKPTAWLCTITKNIALMKIRNNNKYTDYDFSNDLSYAHKLKHDDKLILEAAFKVLKEDEIEIIILYSTNGFKHKEIAEILNIPLSTVLSKYNRSLKKLKSYLEKGGINNESN